MTYLKTSKLLQKIFVCGIILMASSAVYALQTYTVDDFTNSGLQGNAHYFLTGHGAGLNCAEIFDAGKNSQVLCISWDSSSSDLWWFSNTWDGIHASTVLNATPYSHLTFDIKGSSGGENFKIQIQQEGGALVEYSITDFIDSITTTWKDVHIPLWYFYGESPKIDLKTTQAISAAFYNTPSGTIYIDNIRFDGCRIDDFEDNILTENTLRKYTGSGGTGLIESPGQIDGSHKIAWNGPCWWATNTESNQLYACPDPKNFTYLFFKIKGGAGAEKFLIKYQTSPTNAVSVNSSDYTAVTTDWQGVYVPLSAFTSQGVTLDQLHGFAFAFAETGHAQSGTIYIDDVGMECFTTPVADFAVSLTTGAAPLTVSFTNKSIGNIIGCSWNFGDGGTSTEQNPIHTYAAGGTYTVSLTATGPGEQNIKTKTNYISVYNADDRCQIGAFIADWAKDATFPWHGEQGIQNYEAVIQRKVAVIKLYAKIVDNFPYRDCLTISKHGDSPTVPYIDIAAKIYDTGSQPILNDIIKGDYDNYIQSWAEQAKAYGKPLHVCFDGEMNGAWGTPMGSEHVGSGYANGGGILNGYGNPAKPDGPERYVDAWRHIHNIFKAVGADNVAWVWAVNNFDWPADSWNEFENYYPGDEYVDWLGVDGYNWNFPDIGWLTFRDVFETALNRLADINDAKPIILAEYGCAQQEASDPSSHNKSIWITEGFNLLKTTYPYNKVKSLIWFDMNKERNWLIDSDGPESARTALADPYFASEGNPRAPFINLALNKTVSVTASSVETETTYYAGNIADSNLSTRWSSAGQDPSISSPWEQWVCLDLGAVSDIGEIVLRWEAAYASGYEIQVSDNAVYWTTVYSTSSGNGNDDYTILDAPASGRYVRLYCTNRGPSWARGYSLWEFEVYKNALSNVACGKNVVVSSIENTGLEGKNVVDRNFDTRWSSAGQQPPGTWTQWIYVDIGTAYNVEQLVLRWEDAYASGYDIQTSNDAANWTTVYSTSTGDGNDDYINFKPAVTGRYVRVYCTQRGPAWTRGYSLRELEAYGNICVPPKTDFTASPTSGNAPLTVNFTDASTGDIASRLWNFGDTGTSTAQNPAHTYTAVGNYTITLTTTGPIGQDTKIKTGYIHVVDTIPPTGSININNGASYTTSASVVLKLSATDTGSGVRQMQFSNNNSTWSAAEPYAATKAWTLTSGYGTKRVYAKFRDNAGNWSTAYSDTIILDTQTPTGTISINNNASYTTSALVVLNLSATDTGSGVSQMRFSSNNSTWSAAEPYAATKAWTLTSGYGTKRVYAKFRDNAGNWSTAVSDSILYRK